MNKEELKQYIDDNIYENQDGEITGEALNDVLKAIVDDGGTEVEANPTGEATETLSTLKIGETIYTAPQGPQGEPGEDGQDGQPGAPGPANTLSIGTVTDGEQAAAEITGEAPNQQLNLVLPKGEQGDPGQNAVNPFKGWFDADITGEAGSRVTDDTANLPANPVVGDYAYVKTLDISGTAPSQTETPIVKIYECSTAGTWSDSGRTADTSNVQTFASGEEVNETYIDETHLSNPVGGDETNNPTLAKAEDVLQLKAKLEGVTASETKVTPIEDWHPEGSSSGYYNNGSWANNSNFKSTRIDVSGHESIRFLGYNHHFNSFTPQYVFFDDNNTPKGGYHEYYDSTIEDGTDIELNLLVPDGAKYLVCLYKAYYSGGNTTYITESKFYAYLQGGDSVVDLINQSKVEIVDNLDTDDATKALSAKQGKALNEKLLTNKVDLSILPQTSKALNTQSKWSSSLGKSVLIPVGANGMLQHGDVIKVIAINEGDNIAFLTDSDYGSNNTSPNFADGYSARIELDENESQTYTIGNDVVTIYVRMTYSSGSMEPLIYSNQTFYAKDYVDNSIAQNIVLQSKMTDFVVGKKLTVESLGELVEDSSCFVTDYIRIKKDTDIVWGHSVLRKTKSICIALYDSSKQYLTYYQNSDSNNYRAITLSATTNDEYIYIRATFPLEPKDKLWLVANGCCYWCPNGLGVEDAVESMPRFSLDEYITDGCYDEEWKSYGQHYRIPVTKGDVFYLKDKMRNATTTNNIYYYFIDSENQVTEYTAANNQVWNRLEIPDGVSYLGIDKLYNSTTDHTPYIVKVSDEASGVSSDLLLLGTFNSSYNNSIDMDIVSKYCSLLKDKENIETFVFFTDPHLTPRDRYDSRFNANNEYSTIELARDKYITVLQKYYNSMPIDLCICGGDWLNLNHSQAEAMRELGYMDGYMRKLFRRFYPLFGNHDCSPYGATSSDKSYWKLALKNDSMRNLMFRENGGTYYSFDGINTKFYMLDSGVSFIGTMTVSELTNAQEGDEELYGFLVANRWEQIDWLGNKLLTDDADNSVIAMHIYSNAGNSTQWYQESKSYSANGIHALAKNAKNMAVAYNNRENITLNGITYNFSQCTGKVNLILCGHAHFDFVDLTNEIPIVCTTDFKGGYTPSGGSYTHLLRSTFDCCVMDNDDGVLDMVRVGANKDRSIHFQPTLLAISESVTLVSRLSTPSWSTIDSTIATVSNGVVQGVSSGVTGIVATDENGNSEQWLLKVS